MAVIEAEELPIRSSEDIVVIRRVVREWSIASGFSLVEQTKLVTAASELARNALQHGGGGMALIERLNDDERRGVRIAFRDQGPGIPDIEQALRDGFTTGGGLGLGLGGARRLVGDFHLQTEPGQGTTVTIARWK